MEASEPPFSGPRREGGPEVCHWRAQKRDIIFMLSPCVSTARLPDLVRVRRERREGEPGDGGRARKKGRGEDGGGLTGGLTGPCLQTLPLPAVPDQRYSCHGRDNGRSFRYLFTKASHRKTIESNREESCADAVSEILLFT